MHGLLFQEIRYSQSACTVYKWNKRLANCTSIITICVVLGKCDAFVIANFDDDCSKQFVRRLQTLFQSEDLACLTTADFVPGVTHNENLYNAMLFCKIVIVIGTRRLTQNKRVKTDVEMAVAYNINHTGNQVVPILLNKDEGLPPELNQITAILYNSSESDCDKTLISRIKKTLNYQKMSSIDDDSVSAANGTIIELQFPEDDENNEKQSLPTETQSNETVNPNSPNTRTTPEAQSLSFEQNNNQEIETTPPMSSDQDRKYNLNILEPFRSERCYDLIYRWAKVLYWICIMVGSVSIALSFSLSLLINPDTRFMLTLISRILLTIPMFIAIRRVNLYVSNAANVMTNERLEFQEPAVQQIGNHMVAENQMMNNVTDVKQILLCIQQFLCIVARVNFITAWLYPLTWALLLKQLGYFGREIYKGNGFWFVYICKATDFVILILVQGFLRTLIGIYHYERNLLVESHKLQQDPKSQELRNTMSSTATWLHSRINTTAKQITTFGLLLILVAIPVILWNHGITSLIKSSKEALNGYMTLMFWLILLEMLMHCPTRHMKTVAVLANALAVFALHFAFEQNPLVMESLTCFLPFVELRMLCLMSMFCLLLHCTTVLKTNNWPLPSFQLNEIRKRQAPLIIIAIVLLVCSTLLA